MKAKYLPNDMINWISNFMIENHRTPDLIEVARGMDIHHNTVRSYMYAAKEEGLVYFEDKPGRYSILGMKFIQVFQDESGPITRVQLSGRIRMDKQHIRFEKPYAAGLVFVASGLGWLLIIFWLLLSYGAITVLIDLGLIFSILLVWRYLVRNNHS